MKVICFVNNKGGVGKTSSVQNVGAGLARKGFKVVLIDVDPQSNLTISFGIDKYTVEHDAGDFMLGSKTFEEVAMSSDNLSIIPASDKLDKKERVLQGENMYHTFLRRKLRAIESFDYCLIDCPPALGAMTVNALYASDYFFVPLQAEFFSYEGIRKILHFTAEIQQETDLQLGGVFATRFNPRERRKLSRDLVDSTAQQLGDRYMANCNIRVNIAVSEAQAAGEDVFSYAPTSNSAKDYEALTDEIIQRTTHG